MDKFECKAPMYVNFVQSSSLDNNDGADKFFDFFTDEHEQRSGEPKEEQSDVEDTLNLAMKNLWMASDRKNTSALYGNGAVSATKVKVSDVLSSCSAKRKGSPMTQNCQPAKFISMAEAVCRFQTDTPNRFHSKPRTVNPNVSLQHRKGNTMKKNSTVPYSPNLRSHLRSRPVHIMTKEEEEEKEADEMRTFKIKANPLNPKILEPPKLGIRVEKKPPTVPVPFKLTEIVKKKTIMAPPLYTFTAKPVPKEVLDGPQGASKKRELSSTESVSPACVRKSKVYAVSLDVSNAM
ncbi:targeting protein for Xklp2 homolog [Zootermopsis nevadensis]|uniref:targeting protein for Xklp2 homolog n=1 Tax=Zootermopsis nevadensis TaxID=136037 RepID=UPI000B8E25B0|nr:targeting protein for Xklp2 homolog [Zootermopsis nevadensis]